MHLFSLSRFGIIVDGMKTRMLTFAAVVLCQYGVTADVPKSLYDRGDAVFQDVELQTVVELLGARDKCSIMVKPREKRQTKITVHLKQVPKYAILQYVARAARLRCRFESFGAVFEPATKSEPSRSPKGALATALHSEFSPKYVDEPVGDIVQFLAQVMGVNVVCVSPEQWKEKKVTIKLHDVSVLQFLNYVSELCDVPVTLDRWAVVIGERKITSAAPKPQTQQKKRKPHI